MFCSSRSTLQAGVQIQFLRNVSRKIAMVNDVHLSNRRVMKKIKMGAARPTIFHQFDTLVEFSDGSVIKRRSQAPKDEIRLISDQKNNALWNPNRSDLSNGDLSTTGRVGLFMKKFAQFQEEPAENKEQQTDGLVELLGNNVTEVQKGGRLREKRRGKK
ncbi:hypothetical protein METBIDRAFT_86820 [Metschnikowia bicuspidata var. bicuspidata NRRL YB-4993]|uniref:Ribosomal protein bL31m N-terminal domain-containing protein n=1 Tax=Metschnikowia bicuspidata var. bicuspidata NRRL YB-4993 TaxID=869754 RepID=A0A1A0HDM5_9ASCO|nr:hypothetical protein METBIDRAFT_86820 [Metschnikowia bicuspidata var. bicuspidata NRRL YB-4993]OBA22184.1 hypothetical protein METBIDRAFT_86820 [Metschnikowia bicuspidata var. bicuspidata NRRL YB-4993]